MEFGELPEGYGAQNFILGVPSEVFGFNSRRCPQQVRLWSPGSEDKEPDKHAHSTSDYLLISGETNEYS